MTILNKLPLTRIKITIAFFLYKIVSLFVRNKNKVVQKTVKGVTYELDLKEGLDLSMYVLGGFQQHVTNFSIVKLSDCKVVFDVGGNFGFMALQYAHKYQNAMVYSFEPTHYAISKFKKNLELNPELEKRIRLTNTYVSDKTSESSDIKAFSSWKVDEINNKNKERHAIHLGISKSSDGVGTTTLDHFYDSQNIDNVDFIKIDTDGHEPFILKGAKNLITKCRPVIVFEVGKYVMVEKEIDFTFYTKYFEAVNYKLFNVKSEKEINDENWTKIIPDLGTIDVIAIPVEKVEK